jgi:hypothetical protein
MIRCKPVGKGYRLVTVIEIQGGHMERALTVAVGQVVELFGIRWRVLEVLA